MSDDGTKILAVIGLNDFYVWEMDATEVLFSANQAGLQGTWSKVYSEGASLPGNQAKGATCDATFFISEVSVVSHVNHTLLLARTYCRTRIRTQTRTWTPNPTLHCTMQNFSHWFGSRFGSLLGWFPEWLLYPF